MGRTLPSITQAFLQEQQSLLRFRRALRREDQLALDDLLAASRHHLAAAAYASHLLPFETMLLAMLVEEHKLHLQLAVEIERLRHRLDLLESAPYSEASNAPSLALSPPTLGQIPTPPHADNPAAEKTPQRETGR